MPIVYDDEQAAAPAGVVKYDAPAAPIAPPDKYQQAAIAERQRLQAAGVPLPEGFTRRAAAGPFLGWADEINAATMTPFEMARQGTWDPREGYRYAKARETLADVEAAKKTGVLGDVAEIGGGVALLPGQVFSKPLAAAIGGGGKGVLPAAARVGAYGTEAATLGAIQGAGSAETVQDIPREALRAGAVSGVLGAPFGIFGDVARRTTAKVPTQKELMGLGKADYAAREALPLSYDLPRVQQHARDVQQNIATQYGLKAEPAVNAVAAEAARMQAAIDAARAANAVNPATGARTVVPSGQYSGVPNQTTATVGPGILSDIRGNIFEKGATKEPTSRAAAAEAARQFDEILTNPSARFLAPGATMRDAIAAAELTQRGRGNFGAAYRSKAVGKAVDRALEDAATANSGLGFENRLRANIKQAKRADEFQGFSPAEKDDVERFIRGTVKDNLIREVGNRMAGGGGWGSTVLTGGMVGGGAAGAYATGQDPLAGALAGGVLGTSGRAIRSFGNKRIQDKVEAFQEKLRQRSPEYAARVARAPTEIGPGLSPTMAGLRQMITIGDQGAIRDALARMLTYQTTGRRD